jgi:transposase
MHIKKRSIKKNDKTYEYWELVESQRTERGPRHHSVAYLGIMELGERMGMKYAAEDKEGCHQSSLFDDTTPRYAEVNIKKVRVERCRKFGGYFLGMEVLNMLGLPEFLRKIMPEGKEEIEWWAMSLVLILSRLCDASSELAIAENTVQRGALSDILGIPEDKINDDRLYRALDKLLVHKTELEKQLKEKMGELFGLEYDLLLYDVTSTYFEGQANGNEQAQRGYSRDHRSDCKQVCIGLVVSRCGIPLGYEVFDGNRSDVTTVEDIIEAIEEKYGKANREWVMDQGMMAESNLEYMRERGCRYIIGASRGSLKSFEKHLIEDNFKSIREGLEVKLCPSGDGEETFILCRSRDRREKEKAIFERFERRIEEGLEKIELACIKKRQNVILIAKRIGKLLGKNTRAEKLFKIDICEREEGFAEVKWSKDERFREWSELSEGCYLLRSNVNDWSAEDLWRAYIQLTEAESAFRIQKNDLKLRPIWHQKKERVQAHILVCFLSYVVWKALGRLCSSAGLGDEVRKVFDEISLIMMVDVVLPTKSGVEIKRRCVSRPTKHQAILLKYLNLQLPETYKITEM